MTVIPFPNEPLSLHDEDDNVKGMLWGFISQYADDPDGPLPKDPDHLSELLLLTDQAINKLETLRGVIRMELMR